LRREGRWKAHTHAGAAFCRRRDAGPALGRVLEDLTGTPWPDLIVSGANGTFADRAAEGALGSRHADIRTLTPKRQLGEAPGASALLQIVLAAVALQKLDLRHALVPVVGWNQQASAALITRSL
jgi:hypothetical protein